MVVEVDMFIAVLCIYRYTEKLGRDKILIATRTFFLKARLLG